jgi:plastocyanin
MTALTRISRDEYFAAGGDLTARQIGARAEMIKRAMTNPRTAGVMRVAASLASALVVACHTAPPPPAETVAVDPNAYELWSGSDGGSIVGIATLDVPAALREQTARAHGAEGEHQIPPSRSRATLSGVLPDAVVYLADIHRGRAFDSGSNAALLDQREMRFEPRIQLVPPDTTLEIRNSDATSHNVRGVLEETHETLFNYAMPLQDQRLHVALKQPGRVNVMCDMKHGWMKATLVVMRHPYYAITDAQGRFALRQVPPGEYSLRAWHDTFGERTLQVRVRAGEDTSATFSFSVS